MSRSNFFKVFGIDRVCTLNGVIVPLRISGLVATTDQVREPARVERE
jgi:hypothetical protein